MRHSSTTPGISPASLHRRQLLGALGAGALGAWLGGCAAPLPPPPLRPIDSAAAPRVGGSWQYQFRSVFRVPAPRTLEVRVLEVGPDALLDRIAVEGETDGDERSFDSALEMVERPLLADRPLPERQFRRLTVFEFSPYLQAFGALPDGGSVATPKPSWGPAFTGRARLRGRERISVPAGTFDAVRMEYEISRTPTVTMRPQIDPAFTLATVWYAPGPKRPVRWTVVTRASALNVIVDDTYELAAYRPA